MTVDISRITAEELKTRLGAIKSDDLLLGQGSGGFVVVEALEVKNADGGNTDGKEEIHPFG